MGEIKRYRFQGGCGEHEENGLMLLNQRLCEDGEWVKHSDHLADKAAELEDLAGEFENYATSETLLMRVIEATPALDRGKVAGHRRAASRLRERAAELRKGQG